MLEKQIIVTHQGELFVYVSNFANSTHCQLNFSSVTEPFGKLSSMKKSFESKKSPQLAMKVNKGQNVFTEST